MPLNELAELKTQLQDLLEKGFILTKLITMGLSSHLCQEEGPNTSDVRGL
jgi:hypothetical protein